jgi:hypothetical protein
MMTDDLSFDDDQSFPDDLKLNENGEAPELTDLFEASLYPKEEEDPDRPLDEDLNVDDM